MQADTQQRPEKRRTHSYRNAVLPMFIALSQLLVSIHIGHHAHDAGDNDRQQACTICLHVDRFDGAPPTTGFPPSSLELADSFHPTENIRQHLHVQRLQPPATGPPA